MPIFRKATNRPLLPVHLPLTSVKKRSWRFLRTMFAPMSVRDFRLLFCGQLVSQLGDMFYSVALPWFLLTSGGGVTSLSLVLAAYSLPRIFSPLLGGMLSDRLHPRRVMLLTDSVRALLVGALSLLAAMGHPPLWLLCLIMGILGTCSGLFLPASFSILPEVLPEEALQVGNAFNATSVQLAILIGPALAGLTVSYLQPAVGLAIDALSFILSAVSLTLMSTSRIPRADEQGEARRQTESTGLLRRGPEDASPGQGSSTLTFRQLLRSSRLLQMILVMIVFGNFFGAGVGGVALPAYAHDILHAGASGYGLILAAFGIGALMGSMGASSLGKMPHRGVLIILIWLVQAIAITAIPFAGNLLGLGGSMLATGVEGLTNSLGNVTFSTIVQQKFPRHLLGRINGAFTSCQFSLHPISLALSGIIVAHWGPIPVFLVNGVLGLLCEGFSLSQREMREM